MRLGIRTEAAQLNEKGIDPESAMDALLYGIHLYKELADGVILSDIIDIYPQKPPLTEVKVPFEKINSVIGIEIPKPTSLTILNDLGFGTKVMKSEVVVSVPSFRALDISIPEDIIEEIARVYGYYRIPSTIPTIQPYEIFPLQTSDFYHEDHIRSGLKYWGFTEVYTYPMVGQSMYEGDEENAVKLANPLGEEFVYMRRTLLPSLLKIDQENKRSKRIMIFEIANIYEKQEKKLPLQLPHLAILIKENNATFFTGKGVLEALFSDLGIGNVEYIATKSGTGATIMWKKQLLGALNVLDKGLVSVEIDLSVVLPLVTLQRHIKPLSKFPSAYEDIALLVPSSIETAEVIKVIESVDQKIQKVELLDRYQDSRTFHITYQDPAANLTNDVITHLRTKIFSHLESTLHIRAKE